RVQHSRRCLVQTRRRIAGHRLARKPLHHKSAEPVQMDDIFEFHSIAESSAGRNHRVLQLNAGNADGEVSQSLWGWRHRTSPFTMYEAGLMSSARLRFVGFTRSGEEELSA